MGVHNTEAYPEIRRLLEIPEDEPIFILRGQDRAYVPTLKMYQRHANAVVAGDEFLKEIDKCIEEGVEFAATNRDRMKTPD